jgi:hypothetical protein
MIPNNSLFTRSTLQPVTGKYVTTLNLISALAGASAPGLILERFAVDDQGGALIAPGLSLSISYSGLQYPFEKAKIRDWAI